MNIAMREQLISAAIHGIALDQESQLPIVLLKTTVPKGILPIPVGPSEASSIIVEIEGIHPPRPLTHDLIADLFLRHRFRLQYCEIRDQAEDMFTAFMHYTRHLRRYSMEVRPSDAIALALRLEAPIMVNPLLLTQGDSCLDIFRYLHGDDILLLEPTDCKDRAV